MEISKIKKALIEQKNMNLPGNLYHKTQSLLMLELSGKHH